VDQFTAVDGPGYYVTSILGSSEIWAVSCSCFIPRRHWRYYWEIERIRQSTLCITSEQPTKTTSSYSRLNWFSNLSPRTQILLEPMLVWNFGITNIFCQRVAYEVLRRMQSARSILNTLSLTTFIMKRFNEQFLLSASVFSVVRTSSSTIGTCSDRRMPSILLIRSLYATLRWCKSLLLPVQ
jgi:hypothetical protein